MAEQQWAQDSPFTRLHVAGRVTTSGWLGLEGRPRPAWARAVRVAPPEDVRDLP